MGSALGIVVDSVLSMLELSFGILLCFVIIVLKLVFSR